MKGKVHYLITNQQFFKLEAYIYSEKKKFKVRRKGANLALPRAPFLFNLKLPNLLG